ncbi:MAG: threonine--tRNA ligase [Chloroflexota bacterium]|nr:threonine--tRNA ligase [Chloroflexota bacterium]
MSVQQLRIVLSDHEHAMGAGVTAGEALQSANGSGARNPSQAASVIAARINGELRDLAWRLADGDRVEPVEISSPDGRAIVRHSAAHVMAQAVQGLFPGAKLGIGPPVENGFYYDFDTAEPFSPADLKSIEQRMRAIVKQGQRFSRRVVSRDEAQDELADEPYKLELIGLKGGNSAEESVEVGGPELTIYDNLDPASGEVQWKDLCRGPHVPTTRQIPAFKLLRTGGAYWRGSEKNPQLQRIYGTAWESRQAQDTYLHMLEEAERRDHRRLGRELELFHLDPTAPGMPYWLPRGLKLLNLLLDFWRTDHERRGYQEISSPLINDKSLWVTSGHWDHYKDDMFIIPIDERTTYGVKPMNCPNAMVVYNLKTRSYRDLPLRLSDCDVLHRNERSGTLHGLLRVRHVQQDDAHIFVTPDQIRDEYEHIFDVCDLYYQIFDLRYKLRLGTRPEDYIGDVQTWNEAESSLRSILDRRVGAGNYIMEEGGGAFYGPKIDIVMQDALGREWQMGTIQLDFQLPRRFGCAYTDRDGTKKMPVVIHRVIYGSLERFIGILIEHTAGAFPLWISPVQVKVIPVRVEQAEYAREVTDILRAEGFRVEADEEDTALSAKIRKAQHEKTPVMLVLGSREAEERMVAPRLRTGAQLGAMPLAKFCQLLHSEVISKAFTLDSLVAAAST